MIDDELKKKLLDEMAKNGNVYLSCNKTGIGKSSYYRWRKEDLEFNHLASEAIRNGIDNNCNIAEHALMLKIKDKDINAIKYQLSHNSPRYMLRHNKTVRIEHVVKRQEVIKNKDNDVFDDILKEIGLLQEEKETGDKKISDETK